MRRGLGEGKKVCNLHEACYSKVNVLWEESGYFQ